MRRIRRAIERSRMSAVMDQRGGWRGARASRWKPSRPGVGSSARFTEICRVRHFYEQISEQHQLKLSYNWAVLDAAGSRGGGQNNWPCRKYPAACERRPLVGMLVRIWTPPPMSGPRAVNYQPKVTPQLSSESHPLRG
jgi:hypothetical protein